MSLVRKRFDLNGKNFSCWGLVKDNIVYCKLKELSDLLGYIDPSKAYKLIEDKWKFTWSQLANGIDKSSLPPECHNWPPNTLFISEYGISYLIFRSKKPEAKRFRDHVLEVVLPAIRNYGGYISPDATLSQVNDLVKTFREQLLEKETLLTETRNMLEENERTLTETRDVLEAKEKTLITTQGELTEVQGALAEARGRLEETRRELAEIQETLAETREKLEETHEELTEVQEELAETRERLEGTRIELVEVQGALAETRGRLTEEMQQKNQLQNNIQTVRPKIAVIPDKDSVRHILKVFRKGNTYKFIRRQKRSIQQAIRHLSEDYQCVYTANLMPNSISVVNRLKEVLPNAIYDYNKVTSSTNVVEFVRHIVEEEVNRPIAQ